MSYGRMDLPKSVFSSAIKWIFWNEKNMVMIFWKALLNK